MLKVREYESVGLNINCTSSNHKKMFFITVSPVIIQDVYGFLYIPSCFFLSDPLLHFENASPQVFFSIIEDKLFPHLAEVGNISSFSVKGF